MAQAHDSPVFPTDLFTDTDSGGTWKCLPHLLTHFNNTDPGSLLFHLLEYLMIALGTFRFHNSNFKFCWICGSLNWTTLLFSFSQYMVGCLTAEQTQINMFNLVYQVSEVRKDVFISCLPTIFLWG